MANFNKMLKQMQQLQQELMKKQDEVKTLEVTGESAGGLVKVTANCAMEIKRIDIDDEIWKENDKDMLADLVAAAVNTALSSAQEKMNDELSGLTGGMNIPGM
ncbi:YbaB/EbfC family nucleoid-associated protein [Candidatus Calescamantes bacterium]|nr:YbaB/EbfC family nucleoid-associated protein [Candidatus Calescamantes bacterium]